MVNLLKLFCTDRKLLETRGNLIIRQLCVSLSAERIYRTMADCLERDEDVEFASIMVQNLNNNLITAPELADLRKRLRNLDGASRDGQTFFVTLFRAWCHNAVATFSLCLLAQAYEQAYHLLQIFADQIELTVSILIQIDKLVQLLESPVFTALRLQLLEPERYPYLYKCLYGLLMLLPQSSAFAALKNRLHSVAAIGYIQHGGGIAPQRLSAPPTPAVPGSGSFETRSNRLSKARDEGAAVRWGELLDKFKTVQERARRAQQRSQGLAVSEESEPRSHARDGIEGNTLGQLEPGRLARASTVAAMGSASGVGGGLADARGQLRPLSATSGARSPMIPMVQGGGNQAGSEGKAGTGVGFAKGRSSLSQLGRIAGGVGGRNKGKR